MSHLLSLSALHAAAPGVLDIVFGADGDFEGAPLWRPALYMLVGRRFVHDWQRTDDVIWLDLPPHGLVAHGQVALDCRIPSVAARLAGLCARALQMSAADPGPWYWTARGTSAEFGQYGGFERWEVEDGALRPLHLLDSLTLRRDRRAPVLSADAAASRPVFLASLTLSLAPKIAALGGRRG